jgi:hypothetical protein
MTTTDTTPAEPAPKGEKLSLPGGAKPLTMNDAVAALRRQRTEAPKAAEPAPKAAEPAPKAVDDKSLDVETPSDETDIEVGDESEAQPGDEKPALTAPSSYNAQEREAFAALPRPAQEAALRLEQHRRAAFSRDSEAARTARETAERAAQQVEAERQFLLSQVVPLVQQMRTAHMGEFADIRSPQDVQMLAAQDPARFARWQASQVAIDHAERHRQALADQQTAKEQAAEQEAAIAQLRELPKLVKAWSTPEALKSGMAEVQDYVLNQPGIERDDLRRLNKASFVLIARKAMLYDQALARKASASAASDQPTPVTTAGPKPGRVAAGHAVSTYNKAMAQVRETGSIDDALAVMRLRRGQRR